VSVTRERKQEMVQTYRTWLEGSAGLILTSYSGISVRGLDDLRRKVREAGGELGYQFRSRIRAGITVSYTDRVSTIQTFGIEGLLAGFTLQYNPPQPTFR